MSKSSFPFNRSEYKNGFDLQEIVDKISARKTLLIGIFFGIIAFLIIAYKLLSHQTANAEADFIRAQTTFSRFQQTIVSDPEAAFPLLNELEDLLKRYPDLRAKYDGAVAQSLLLSARPALATPFAEAVFTRTSPDRLDPYKEFSQTSLLISTGEYPKALERALELQKRLDAGKSDPDSALYAFNLIRIAVLRNQAGQFAEEKEAWTSVRNYLAASGISSEINEALRAGQAPLNGYIDNRLKASAGS